MRGKEEEDKAGSDDKSVLFPLNGLKRVQKHWRKIILNSIIDIRSLLA